MAHTLTENTILSVYNYRAAWTALESIFQACEGEYALNFGEDISSDLSNAIAFLFERRFIVAAPIETAPYRFVPSETAREYFTLCYGENCREPRFASEAKLQGLWD